MDDAASFRDSSSPKSFKQGLVQVFTGDGKGKTSAALGVVLRALGHGLRVCLVVFMKGKYSYGEWDILGQLDNVRVARYGTGTFTDPANLQPEEIDQAKEALLFVREAMLSGQHDVIILDEVNVATAWKLVELDEVIRLVQDKPANVELILTGRGADPRLVEMADLVTECLKIKHPYDAGIIARAGIDY